MWRPGLVQRDCAGLGLTVERPPSVCLPRLCLSPLSPGLYSLHVWRDNLNTSSLPSQSQYPRSVWKPVQAPFRIQPQTRLRTRATPGWLLLDLEWFLSDYLEIFFLNFPCLLSVLLYLDSSGLDFLGALEGFTSRLGLKGIWKSLHLDSGDRNRMDFTYIWLLATTLMFIHQHQGKSKNNRFMASRLKV